MTEVTDIIGTALLEQLVHLVAGNAPAASGLVPGVSLGEDGLRLHAGCGKALVYLTCDVGDVSVGPARSLLPARPVGAGLIER